MRYSKEELNQKIRELIQSPWNLQEFVNLASLEENWEKIDKSIALPRYIGFGEEECPCCQEIIRLIYDKFSEFDLLFQCPHCEAELSCVGEFTGYTTEFYLKEHCSEEK